MSTSEKPTQLTQKHPSAFEPTTLVLMIVVSAFGAVIGMQIITTLGVTPNTAIIGVLVAIALSRIPIAFLKPLRSVHRQNLIQSNVSTATFAAANSLLLPIGIPFILGKPNLVWPMLIGAALAMVIDILMLFWIFDSKLMPGSAAWPPGLAAAEAIKAGDEGGKRAGILGIGTGVGLLGSWMGIPMAAFGVAFIGNIVALTMFGLGLLARGYSEQIFGFDIAKEYIPHGLMIGAGIVALIQAMLSVRRKRSKGRNEDATAQPSAPVAQSVPASHNDVYTRDESDIGKGLVRGLILYLGAAIVLAVTGGLLAEMSVGQLAVWVVYAAISCLAAEFIIGLSAMHSGWFPAFATALIFLTIGIIIGFSMVPLALMVGFIAAGGPAFADGGYDFKAGWILRNAQADPRFELEGRRQQLYAGLIGMAVALVVVAATYQTYFTNDQFPPIVRVYKSTIEAGLGNPELLGTLALWAIPGAIIQALGGPKRQMGILLATGTLIFNPIAGWTVLAGILLRIVYTRWRGEAGETDMTVAAAGFIAGDALWGFGTSMFKTKF